MRVISAEHNQRDDLAASDGPTNLWIPNPDIPESIGLYRTLLTLSEGLCEVVDGPAASPRIRVVESYD